MKKSSTQPGTTPVVHLSDISKNPASGETPKDRVERLYAVDGGPLLGWLMDEAQLRGQLLNEMASALGVTYGYINQLRNGIRKVSHISNEFARSCANYLGVPTVVVKLVSGTMAFTPTRRANT